MEYETNIVYAGKFCLVDKDMQIYDPVRDTLRTLTVDECRNTCLGPRTAAGDVYVYITMTVFRVLAKKSWIVCHDETLQVAHFVYSMPSVQDPPFFMHVHDRPEIVAFLERWGISAYDVVVFK